MDWDTQESLWLAITQIEAQDVLINLTIAQYPWLKKEQQKKIHREMHRKAYPKTHERVENLTTRQLAERLKQALNG